MCSFSIFFVVVTPSAVAGLLGLIGTLLLTAPAWRDAAFRGKRAGVAYLRRMGFDSQKPSTGGESILDRADEEIAQAHNEKADLDRLHLKRGLGLIAASFLMSMFEPTLASWICGR